MQIDNELKIPTIKEIKKIPSNGLKVISLFSGAGGSSLGYRMAGFDVIWINEFMKKARETYKLNAISDTFINGKDIRQLTGSEILNQVKFKKKEIDILDGSPPCASFSTAGNRDKDWGKIKNYSKTAQRTDDLFFEYIRILKEIQPKVFVAENVSGLVKGRAKGYFLEILKEFNNSGYNVKVQLIKAQYLNVPQMRERIFFIGVRKDIYKMPVFPKPKKKITKIIDVIDNLTKNIQKNEICYLGKETRTYKLWKNTIPGNDFQKAGELLYGKKSSYFGQKKAGIHKPCNSICATPALYHWNEPRYLSIPEIKLFSSFPEDFVVTGSFSDRFERVGRAVPPFVMKEIAKSLRNEIFQ
tara:strand:- start:1600 stop:2667 length:1068 start_codon:yes stop_codon:yes gene_type:complete